jgi:hypothetical protein
MREVTYDPRVGACERGKTISAASCAFSLFPQNNKRWLMLLSQLVAISIAAMMLWIVSSFKGTMSWVFKPSHLTPYPKPWGVNDTTIDLRKTRESIISSNCPFKKLKAVQIFVWICISQNLLSYSDVDPQHCTNPSKKLQKMHILLARIKLGQPYPDSGCD